MKIASPGAISRSSLNPATSKATLSDATMYSILPSSSTREPRTKGRMPKGSRKATRPAPMIRDKTA